MAERLSSTQRVDIIQKIVYEQLKPLGFRKHGRVLHRFVDGDISQVVHFQNGCPPKGIHDVLWVDLGIRVPECQERTFHPGPQKKYYQEYECNIRTRLGMLLTGKDVAYDLAEDPQKIGEDILAKLLERAIPIFQVLSSRDGLLMHREENEAFDMMKNRLRLLDEAMIFGRRGDIEKAAERFRAHYRLALEEYEHGLRCGTKIFLREGERMTYLDARSGKLETVTGSQELVTVYNANRNHLTYLEGLAKKLEISL